MLFYLLCAYLLPANLVVRIDVWKVIDKRKVGRGAKKNYLQAISLFIAEMDLA